NSTELRGLTVSATGGGRKATSSPVIFPIAVCCSGNCSDDDCYLSNFRPRQCGLFIVILSSTLSLKTVHRTVFLTVAFKSRHTA
ncbi:MAG: hypothetical protein WAT80_06670, partial [Ruminococcus bromii]